MVRRSAWFVLCSTPLLLLSGKKVTSMTSIYVVHSRVIPLCEHPFCYQDELRPVWEPFFQDMQGFTPYLISPSSSLSRHPFLNTLGPLVFNTHRSNVLCGQSDTVNSWLLEKLSAPLQNPYIQPCTHAGERPCTIFGFDPQLADQRQSLLYLECARRIPLRSNGMDDARAQGNFYIHVYPAGYLVVNLALNLNWQHPRSMAEVAALVGETRPWRSDGAWRWESRLANGKIHYLYLRLRTALFSAFFESHHTALREGEWKTFIKHCFQETTEELGEALGGGEISSSLRTDINGLQTMILSAHGALLGFPSGDHSRTRQLKYFWQVLQLAEYALLRKQIHADIFTRTLGALQILQPLLSGQFPSVESHQSLESAALDENLVRYLQVLEGYYQQLKPESKELIKEFSYWLGVDSQRWAFMAELEGWQQQMGEWDPAFVAAWNPIYRTLQEIFPL